MYVMTRCSNNACPQKTRCYRQTKPRTTIDSNFEYSYISATKCESFLLRVDVNDKTVDEID